MTGFPNFPLAGGIHLDALALAVMDGGGKSLPTRLLAWPDDSQRGLWLAARVPENCGADWRRSLQFFSVLSSKNYGGGDAEDAGTAREILGSLADLAIRDFRPGTRWYGAESLFGDDGYAAKLGREHESLRRVKVRPAAIAVSVHGDGLIFEWTTSENYDGCQEVGVLLRVPALCGLREALQPDRGRP